MSLSSFIGAEPNALVALPLRCFLSFLALRFDSSIPAACCCFLLVGMGLFVLHGCSVVLSSRVFVLQCHIVVH